MRVVRHAGRGEHAAALGPQLVEQGVALGRVDRGRAAGPSTRARSMRTGVTSVPNADSTLALTGKIDPRSTRAARRRRRRAPARRRRRRAASRRAGRRPARRRACATAAAMFWLTSSWMPAAVSATGRPSASATDAQRRVGWRRGRAACRRRGSSRRRAGRAARSASVTAGSVPPRP